MTALLASLPQPWRDGQLTPLRLGLTNCNYRLQLRSGEHYFLRSGHPDPARLGIDRHTEWQLYQGAVACSLALPCYHCDPARGVMLLAWSDEPTWAQAAPPLSEQPRLLAAALQQLHQLPQPRNVMAVRAHSARYRAQLAHLPRWLPALERALLTSCEPRHCWRPCHHDLNPANLLGATPWIIDWEYGATGHPGFELACIQRTHQWQSDQRSALEDHYLSTLPPTFPRHLWPKFQSEAFLPWVDYIGLLWALLMNEQQPSPDYDALIALNRQRLE
ncbi:MAG: phosphotransferase [Aeromonas sp.]